MSLVIRRVLPAALLCVCAMLGACAGPRQGLLTPVAGAAEMPEQRVILAATTRAPAMETPPGYLFSGERGDAVRYARLTFSLPPGRAVGALPVDADKPDPQRHITLASAILLDAAGFSAAIRHTTPGGPRQRQALVFIHGYNTEFDEAAVRLAQIVADTHFDGTAVLFSWPSRGGVTDYGYDRASADLSRDALEDLLRQLARDPTVSGVDIFAHSLGNWLTIEALRQLVIAGDRKTLGRLGKVVLAAPDVDMDVFRSQAARLGRLPGHMTVYVSRDDYALRMSRRLAGDKVRAGENTDLDQFHRLGIRAHDLSNVAGGVGRNHGKAFGDAATLARIGQSLTASPGRNQTGDLLAGSLHALGASVTTIGQTLLPSGRNQATSR